MAIHSVIQKMLEAAKDTEHPGFAAGTPEQARAQLSAIRAGLGGGVGEVNITELKIPTRAGSIPSRLYSTSATPQGLVLYLHGGGWVCGGLDDFALLAHTLATLSGFDVLLLDYRLAPEHPFPAGLHDVEDALGWCAGAGYGALVVAGDSAGANLGISAVLATYGQVDVAKQVYFYPVTDCNFERNSYSQFSEGMPLTLEDMKWFFGHYAPNSEWEDPNISVLKATNLSVSPSTWIATAEYDVLRDEGEQYASLLRDAGVAVELYRAPGLVHGFARLFNLVDSARVAVEKAAGAIAAVKADPTS